MNNKKWIKLFFLFSFLLIIPIGIFNYIIDPHWSFRHENKLNSMQLYFNERQQKTNYVYFNGLVQYQGLLLGSSRTTFINQNNFYKMNIYNYSLDAMYPFEYEAYLNFAKTAKKKDFKYIIIGADFYNSMKIKNKNFNNPKYYLEKTTSFLYRYKMLLSIHTLKKSIDIIKFNKYKGRSIYYTRDNIKHNYKVSEKERQRRYTINLHKHTKRFIGKNYQWNKEYIKILKKLKKNNPNTKFIIFTSPITANLLVSIIKNGKRINEFEKWLKEIIEVFGEVHHFMTINSITINLKNYPDDDHFYPYIGKLLANKISNKENNKIPNNFGILLNKNNIDKYLLNFKKKVTRYKVIKIYND